MVVAVAAVVVVVGVQILVVNFGGHCIAVVVDAVDEIVVGTVVGAAAVVLWPFQVQTDILNFRLLCFR